MTVLVARFAFVSGVPFAAIPDSSLHGSNLGGHIPVAAPPIVGARESRQRVLQAGHYST